MPSPARKTAYSVLLRLESGHRFAADLLQSPEVSDLKEADRRLATEIVMGVLRWRGDLDFRVEQLSGKRVKSLDSEVLTILRMGVYQIRLLERVPKRAIVNDAVELTKAARKRSAAGFVNAVLRKCEPSTGHTLNSDWTQLSPADWDSVRRAFPSWLLKRWERNAAITDGSGEEDALRLALASLLTPHPTFRVVSARPDLKAMRQELEADGVATSPCLYAEEHGLRVESGQVKNSAAYREGRVVIQDEASQLVAQLVVPQPGQRVLDLCAAPGMKAGQLAHMLGAGVLVACDHSASRLRTMRQMLPPSVPAGVQLSMLRLDAAHPLPFNLKFDRILLDAPCSGTGTLARNPEIKWRLTPEDITRLAELQVRMLRCALPALADGGRLVYATCSLEPEENKGVVDTVLTAEPEFRLLSAPELTRYYPRQISLFDSRGYFSTRPDRHAMDGFNGAVIVRR
jgi:16S rRNA (cytosine967-C5)-methyltransferase